MSIFSKIPIRAPKRNVFDLSFESKFSADFGKLIPCLVQETLPGDVFRHNHELFLQFMPLNAQLMQNFSVDVHYFHVPVRLIYDDFEKFLVGGSNGSETFVPPYFTPAALDTYYNRRLINGTLMDFLGLPDNVIYLGDDNSKLKDLRLSILPFRAYWKIYDDFFRDENLCPERMLNKEGGPCSESEIRRMIYLLNRAWRKDYFTSALPWTQKGDEVILPLGDKAPLKTDAVVASPSAIPTYHVPVRIDEVTSTYADQELGTRQASNYSFFTVESSDPSAAWYADLSNASVSSLDQLRTAEMVQEWLEKNARGGTRYNEQIFSHFGVRTPDSRLDRSEFIGWSSSPVICGNVFSTNSSTSGGNVQAFPVSTANSVQPSKRWKYKVKEHGYIIGVLSVRPRAAYFQGIPKFFVRNDKFDYYWPEFANLGEQAIKDFELYASPNVAPDSVFGYTPRYADLKVRQDEVHGDFRQSLNFYHDARLFASSPSLGQQFIEVRQDEDYLTRIFNNISADNNKLLVNIRHNLKSVRPMPYFGTPMFKPY